MCVCVRTTFHKERPNGKMIFSRGMRGMSFLLEGQQVKSKNNTIEITALINPKISIISEDTDNQWEGCLSIPGMTGLVKRYSKIDYEGF